MEAVAKTGILGCFLLLEHEKQVFRSKLHHKLVRAEGDARENDDKTVPGSK